MTGRPSSASRIIAYFGGQTAMARAMGIKQSTVFGWSRSGRIPPWRHSAVLKAASHLDPPVTLTAPDFVDLDPAPETACQSVAA